MIFQMLKMPNPLVKDQARKPERLWQIPSYTYNIVLLVEGLHNTMRLRERCLENISPKSSTLQGRNDLQGSYRTRKKTRAWFETQVQCPNKLSRSRCLETSRFLFGGINQRSPLPTKERWTSGNYAWSGRHHGHLPGNDRPGVPLSRQPRTCPSPPARHPTGCGAPLRALIHHHDATQNRTKARLGFALLYTAKRNKSMPVFCQRNAGYIVNNIQLWPKVLTCVISGRIVLVFLGDDLHHCRPTKSGLEPQATSAKKSVFEQLPR